MACSFRQAGRQAVASKITALQAALNACGTTAAAARLAPSVPAAHTHSIA